MIPVTEGEMILKKFSQVLQVRWSHLFLMCIIWSLTAGPVTGQDQVIRIGILLPDDSDPQIRQAACLAVEQARSGSSKNYDYELVVRTTEGPWGAGSKESVALVFEDSVLAIVGSLDGRNAHLAEQVSAKSHLVYLETRATDPTLSQAFVPWFMRCVPGDDHQAETIVEEIRKDGPDGIAILSYDDYDTRHSVRSLVKAVARSKAGSPLIVDWQQEEQDFQVLAEKLRQHRTSHLIIPFYHPSFRDGVERIRRLLPDLKIIGNLAFTMGLEEAALMGEGTVQALFQEINGTEGILMACPGSRFSAQGRAFREQFMLKYGNEPGSSCSYMYDAVNLVIDAVEHRGADRDSLKDILTGTSYAGGATGTISFDEWGNREQPVRMMTFREGGQE